MNNFLIILNWKIHRFLVLLGLRSRKNYWGVIYDSVSKQPVDPVIVKLIEAVSGKVKQTAISDISGRYGFLAEPGKYKIFAQKTNYLFPSKLAAGEDDGLFSNLYHGEFFEVRDDSGVVAFNIPLDRENFDWNQEAKKPKIKLATGAEKFLFSLSAIGFWFVFLLLVLRIYFGYNQWILAGLFFYGFVFLLAMVCPQPRLWGRVILPRSVPLPPNCQIELGYSAFPNVVAAKATISDSGKFFLLIKPGRYILRIKPVDSEGKPQEILKQQTVKIGAEGVFCKNIQL